MGGTFQGARISLGEATGETGTCRSTGTPRSTPPSFPVNKFIGTNINAGTGVGSSTPLKALPDKSATSKFTETKVSLGNTPSKEFTKNEISTQLNKKTITGSSGSYSKPKFDNDNKIPDGYKAVGESGSQTLVKLDIKPKLTTTKINLGIGKVVKKPKIIQTPAQIQVPKVKAGVKPPIVSPKIGQSIKGKSITKPKIDHTTGTGLMQGTSQIIQQGLKQMPRTKQMPKIKQVPKLKFRSGQKQTQRYAQLNKLPPPLMRAMPSRQNKPMIIVIPEPAVKTRNTRGKKGKKAGFIGNVRLDNIMGMYKRKEITYGKKKVTKLERQDARLTSGTSNRIAMPASGLLKTKKKKKEKKTSVFGGGKDEFAGFGSKSKGKKKKTSLFG